MNERLPYEEQLAQQWDDLPLPDENIAWKDMERRLDDNDDDSIIPVWLRGCGLWSLLAIVLLGLGWWFVRPDKWLNRKQRTENVTTTDQKEKKDNNNTTRISSEDTSQKIKETVGKKSKDNNKNVLIDPSADSSLTPVNQQSKKSLQQEADQKKDVQSLSKIVKMNKNDKRSDITSSPLESARVRGAEKKKRADNKKKKAQIGIDKVDMPIQPAIKSTGTDNRDEIKNGPVPLSKDSTPVATDTAIKKDSGVTKSLADSIPKKISEPAIKPNDPKKDSSKPKTIFFAAGLGMHQLLPVGGQKLNPYNSAGRKGSFADYIPSVFARMYKNDKWFLELEFRYGAPQYTKEFVYQQRSKIDTFGSTTYTSTTSTKLKKTFYHQLPLTFNYFILPGWSVGTGITWNKFVSAVSQQDIGRRNNTTGAIDSVSKNIITDKNDSLFKRSYFQAVFETQYRWRRFSIGARYSFGLQPYIKFTLPGGVQGEERNKSLQLFMRYELWKSKTRR